MPWPLPKPDDIFATLAGGKYFSKIDLTHAYQQLKLSKSSRDLVTVNTHRGLYRYTRLPVNTHHISESDGYSIARAIWSDMLFR